MSTSLSDKAAHVLARQIVSEASNVRVKRGRTNGKNVLHVFVPGDNKSGRTISCAADWETHPANEQAAKQQHESVPVPDLVITHKNA